MEKRKQHHDEVQGGWPVLTNRPSFVAAAPILRLRRVQNGSEGASPAYPRRFRDPVPGDSKKWRDYPYANLQLREATQGVYNKQSDDIFANNGNEDADVINAMFDAYRPF